MPLNLKKWDELPAEYRWAAQDEDGLWYAYTVIPEAINDHWWYEAGGKCAEIGQQDPPNPNWKATLQERPNMQTPNQPDWDKLPEWANWVATDRDGAQWAYENKPVDQTYYWGAVGKKIHLCSDDDSTWRNTLQERPKPAYNPWDNAPNWANYVAQDKEGQWYAYMNKPHLRGATFTEWVEPSRDGYVQFIAKRAPNPNWQSTLQKRPQEPNYYFWGIQCSQQ